MLPPLPMLLMRADPAPGALQAWIGPALEAAPFQAFARARREDLGAGAREPYRSWLVGLMRTQPGHLQAWAATRLVEAAAPVDPGQPSPNGYLLAASEERFNRAVRWGNGAYETRATLEEDPPASWRDLGRIAELPDGAPCWAAWRAKLQAVRQPLVTLAFYSLFAPHLQAEDRGWVAGAFAAAAAAPTEEPWNSLAWLLGTDWLMLYGQAEDWAAFQAACTRKPWRRTLDRLQRTVRSLPSFQPHAAPLGPSPANQVPPRVLKDPVFSLDYPAEALHMGFSTQTGVLAELDAQGRIQALRLRPGYALGLFGPNAVRWVAAGTYAPATLEGQPRASGLLRVVRFILKRY